MEAYSDPLWVGVLTAVHGVLGGVSIEWTSVVLGLVCTAAGFFAGGLAVVRLGRSRGSGTVLPIGMLVASVVAGVWEFATSGLEMSVVFLWLGLSYFLLVRFGERRRRAAAVAVVVGLGPLIRPELVLVSAVLLATLVVLVPPRQWAPGRCGPSTGSSSWGQAWPSRSPTSCSGRPTSRCGCPPPDWPRRRGRRGGPRGSPTCGTSWPPTRSGCPLLCAVPFVALRAGEWWRAGDRSGVLLLVAPMAAAGADLLYVVSIGGDYMHARLLLPGPVRRRPPLLRHGGPVAGMARRALRRPVRLGDRLRRVAPVRAAAPHPPRAPDGVHLQRAQQLDQRHRTGASGDGGRLRGCAVRPERVPCSSGRPPVSRPTGSPCVVVTNPFLPVDTAAARPARSALPFALAVNLPAIGVIGFVAGPRVYVYDEFSLANPVGSHTTVTHHARPGHEKFVGPAWMVGRFGVPGAPGVPGGPAPAEVAAARRALGCDPLRSYLRAITAPLTLSRAFDDLTRAAGFTTMRSAPTRPWR